MRLLHQTLILCSLLLSASLATAATGPSPWVRNVTYASAEANLFAAKTASPAGATIMVGPGTYTIATNLFKNRVNWEFHDSILDVMGSVLDHGSGVFDDRFSGAVTSTISGTLTIKYCPGTNVHWDEVCSPVGNSNALGAVVLTNALSELKWLAQTRIGAYGPAPFPSCIYVENCRSNTVFNRVTEFFNSHPWGAYSNAYTLTTCPADPGSEYIIPTGASPLYWELGTFHLYFDRMPAIGGNLAIGAYGVDENDSAEMFLHGQLIDGKVYAIGRSKNWKIWLDVAEIKHTDTGLDNTLNFYRAGSHYVRAQKVSSVRGPVIQLELGGAVGTVDTNLVLWVDIDKVSGSNGWASITHGHLLGRVGHFEQNGAYTPLTPAILVTNISARVSLSGEYMAYPSTLLTHGGGLTELHSYLMQGTNNDPVLVTGSGLTLNGVRLKTSSGTNSIRAASGQIVTASAVAAPGLFPHTNVTVLSAQRRVLGSSSTAVASAGLAATNMMVVHVPAHQLTNSGDRVQVQIVNRYSSTQAGANSNSLVYGATTLLATGAQASSNCAFTITATIASIPGSPSLQSVTASLQWGGAGTPYLQTNVVLRAAEAIGVSTALRFVTHQPNNGGVTNENYLVEYVPNQ